MKYGCNYPSDVTDKQWQLIERLLPKLSRRGRPPVDRREVINAIWYVMRSGCQRRRSLIRNLHALAARLLKAA